MIQHKALIVLLGAAVSGMAIAAAGNLAPADSTFVRKAAEGGMEEVKLGQLAKEKGSNQAVKNFGDRMVKDHSKANDELKNVASKTGVTLRDSMNAKDKALYDRLSRLSGDAFDKAYMRAMIEDHQEDVAEFRQVAQSAKDPDVRQFASKTLPTLEEHLRMAKNTASQVGAMSTTGNGATAQKQ
jgi:putative membrane protein